MTTGCGVPTELRGSFDEFSPLRRKPPESYVPSCLISRVRIRSTSVLGILASAAFMLLNQVSPPWAGISSEYSIDRKSTRLNSSHSQISYAVFCLKKKKDKKN